MPATNPHHHEVSNVIELGNISRKGLRFTATPHDIARLQEACKQALAKAEAFDQEILVHAHAPTYDEL